MIPTWPIEDITCDTCGHKNRVNLQEDNVLNTVCEECGEGVFEFRRERYG